MSENVRESTKQQCAEADGEVRWYGSTPEVRQFVAEQMARRARDARSAAKTPEAARG